MPSDDLNASLKLMANEDERQRRQLYEAATLMARAGGVIEAFLELFDTSGKGHPSARRLLRQLNEARAEIYR